MSHAPLRDYLQTQKPGDLQDPDRVTSLLTQCWRDLQGNDATRMQTDKLWRMEELTWNPPCLEFSIERHGQTVMGSSRGTLYRWQVNVDSGTAGIIGEKRRQLYAMDKRLDVKPIAESLADAIVHGKEDVRIAIGKDGSMRLKIGEIIPATNNQTTGARRSRLRKHLATILGPHGWKERSVNVYYRHK